MRWDNFIGDWSSTKKANIILLAAVGALALSNMFLAGRLATERHSIVLVPPKMDQVLKIGYNDANPAFYKEWALYAAELAGNLTPSNANFVAKALQKIVSPDVYQALSNAIYAEKDQEAQYHVVTTFQADSIIWQPQTSTAFVTGYLHQVAPNGKYASGAVQTYEMNFTVQNDQPVITAFRSYPGIPHTLSWLKDHEKAPQ